MDPLKLVSWLKRGRTWLLAASYAWLAIICWAAWAERHLHAGILAVIPLLVIAFYLPKRAALLTAFLVGVAVTVLDRDLVPGGAFLDATPAADAIVLSLSLCAVVFAADLLRRADVQNAMLQTDLESAQAAALCDPLTGVANRARLMRRLSECIASLAPGLHVAVLFADLDRFKEVNDRAGHAVGDRLLALAAQRIENSVRGGDLLARVGGDEFVVVLDRIVTRFEAQHVVSAIKGAFADPFHVGDATFSIGITVGVSVTPEDGEDAELLLAAADADMYRQKYAASQ
jgi:diguanylate cyclase (GGDEF)-like protein